MTKRKCPLIFCLSAIPISILIAILLGTKQPEISTHLQNIKTPTLEFTTPVELTETHSGLPSIDCIYVINLERRFDKWLETKKLCEAHQISPNRLNAIDGKNLSAESIKKLRGHYKENLGAGQIGCILSHLSAIQDGYQRGFETIWILEDDIEIHTDVQIIPKLINELAQIHPEWDVFYTDPDLHRFFYWKKIDPRPDQKLLELSHYRDQGLLTENIRKSGIRLGAHSLILSKKGMKKILDYFAHVYLWAPYDWDLHYTPNINEFSSTEYLITQKKTQIHDTRSTYLYYFKELLRGTRRTMLQQWKEFKLRG